MSKSDWAVVALNVFTLLMAVVGLTEQHRDPMSMALALTLVTTLVNGGWVLRRASTRESAPLRTPEPEREPEEFDARALLDIDARLEALERHRLETAEADRIQQMAARGEQSAPAASRPVHREAEADRVRA